MNNNSIIKRIKLQNLDSLELFSASNSSQDFPLHYHETFCISLIKKGAFIENDKIALQNSLLISNPLEVHKNSAFQNLDYSIQTLYVSKDIFEFVGKNNVNDNSLLQNIITDSFVFDRINELFTKIISNASKETNFESNLFNCINLLNQFRIKSIEKDNFNLIAPSWIEEIKHYLKNNLDQKISLESLANKTKLDKFQFIRAFKKHTGLTPFQYIILSRISLTKKLLQEGNPITQAALEAGFYDQSSFANYFKNYVGVTPKTYQKSFNIVQD